MNDRRSHRRVPIDRVGRMAEEHRRRSGGHRTKVEREPARTMQRAVVHRSSRTSDAEIFCVRPSALSSAMRYMVVTVAFSIFNNLGNSRSLAAIPLPLHLRV